MSIETMAIVLHHSRAKGSAKLVLLGIANHDGDGGAWPSVKTLAKYAACSVSQVQRSLADLERLGEIRRDIQAGGDHRMASHERPNRYHVLLQCPIDCDRTKHHRTRASQQRILDLDPEQLPGLDDTDPVAPMRPGTRSHPCDPVAPTRPGGVAPMRPKPSSEPITKEPRTKPSNRARAKRPVWNADKCPGNWRHGMHEVAAHGACSHCHERPIAYAYIDTGELA